MKKSSLTDHQVDILNEVNFAKASKGPKGVAEVLRRHGITAETLAEWQTHVITVEEFLRQKGWDKPRRGKRKPAIVRAPITGTAEQIAVRFDHWISAPNPSFALIPSAGADIELRNTKGSPASKAGLRKLEGLLSGSSPDLVACYRRFDGGRFFAYANDVEQCFYFLPVGRMAAAKRELEDWVFMHEDAASDYREEPDDDGRLCLYGAPPWWKSVLVFAGFGYAPERLFLTAEGQHAGKVFFYDHDSDCSIEIAPTVRHLLADIEADAAKFVGRYGTGFHDLKRYRSGASSTKGTMA